MAHKYFYCILFFSWTVPAIAQSSNHPADNIFLEVNTSFAVVKNSFTRTWDSHPGLQATIRIPFYKGLLGFGTRYTRYTDPASFDTDADFHSFFIYMGWGYPIKISSRFSTIPTLRFGNNLMVFDKAKTYVNDDGTERSTFATTESEFAYAVALRNRYQISKRWFISAAISYNRTLTYFPIPVTLVSIGVTHAITEPIWLKHFLR